MHGQINNVVDLLPVTLIPGYTGLIGCALMDEEQSHINMRKKQKTQCLPAF